MALGGEMVLSVAAGDRKEVIPARMQHRKGRETTVDMLVFLWGQYVKGSFVPFDIIPL
jgi:hypothetical protein